MPPRKVVTPFISLCVAIFAILAFLTTIFFLPAAELMPAQVTQLPGVQQLPDPVGPGSLLPGLSPVRSPAIMNFYAKIAGAVTEMMPPHTANLEDVVKQPARDNLPGWDRAYLMYAVFLAAAMVFAAIAINAIGRLDSEEMTTVPVKK